MQSLQLAQQRIQGPRYALQTWTAHARATVPAPSTPYNGRTTTSPKAANKAVLSMATQASTLDSGWYGELVIELEGTAEALHDLIVRCAGPYANSHETRKVLAGILDPQASEGMCRLPPLRQAPFGLYTKDHQQYTFPFHILREKCAPGRMVVHLLPVASGTAPH